MQRIEHKYINVSSLLDEVEKTYFLTSNADVKEIDRTVSSLMQPIVDVMTGHAYLYPIKYRDEKYPVVNTVKDPKTYIVCISGGKDSVATAKYLKDKGYDIILYHMHGINQAYYDEFTVIPKLAKSLGAKYHIDNIKLVGPHQYVEHPMKNMLIANGAITYCVQNNLPVNIAFGNYSSSKLEDMEFDVCGGDSRDMWDIYERIIQNIIPDFHIYTPLKDISETYKVLGGNMDLIKKSISCISPYRFRKYWAERTQKKYKIKLLPNRCGCCHKCCLEYMVLTDAGILAYNKEYYNHCFDILKKTARKETGIELTDQEVWDRYFWYTKELSYSEF